MSEKSTLKKKYQTPTVLDLGELARGAGQIDCVAGPSATQDCTQGDAATRDCTAGLAATGTTCSAGEFAISCTGGNSN